MSDCVMFVCFTCGSKIFACSKKYLVQFRVKVVARCYWRQVGQVGGGNQRTTPPRGGGPTAAALYGAGCEVSAGRGECSGLGTVLRPPDAG